MSRRFFVLAVAVAAATTGGIGSLPGGASVPAAVAVVDSQAAAAPVGVVSRVPAETAGGLIFTATSITLDKAIARAAGFTPGPLGEAFIESSAEQYRNASLVVAQYPPSDAFPAEASFAGGQETPGGAPLTAQGARLHAVASEEPLADAEATAGRVVAGAANVAVTTGSSTSRSELQADGTLLTRAISTASGIRIAGLVSIGSAQAVAQTVVPPAGEPSTTLEVTISGLLVDGVPATLSEQGLRIGDQSPVDATTLARFNAAVEALQQKGITVTAAPATREALADRARAEGAALRVRYSVAAQMGGDEEISIAQASSRSTIVRRRSLPLPPTVPAARDVATATVDTPEVAGPAGVAQASATSASEGESGGIVASGFAPSPSVPDATEHREVAAGAGEVAGSPAAFPGSRPETALGVVGPHGDAAVNRIRKFYGSLVLVALLAAGLFAAASRSRLIDR